MFRSAGLAVLLLVAPVAACSAEPPELLGRWVMEGERTRVLELRSGGTGTMDGQPLTWSANGTKLTITDGGGTDTTDWKVTENRLVLTVGFGSEMVFLRAQDQAPPRDAPSRGPG